MFSSIRVRLIATHAALLLALLALLALFLYAQLSRIVYDGVDARLLARAQALAAALDSDERVGLDVPDEIQVEYREAQAGRYFQVRDPSGKVVASSPSLQGETIPLPAGAPEVAYQHLVIGGEPARAVSYAATLEEGERDAGRHVVIQVAESTRPERHLLHRFAAALLAAIAAILVASAVTGILVAGAALRPVRQIAAAIERVSEENLGERIDVEPVAPELRGVAAAFNRTAARLEAAFRRQQEFSADASHELRTPLAVIVSESEIALRRPRPAEEYRSALATVLHTARLMASMVEKMLRMARLGTERGALQMESLDLADVIGDAGRLIAPLAAQRGVRLECPAGPESHVRGDRAGLTEVFMNLLDNAVKYNRPGGLVSVRLSREDGHVVAAIADTGIGIPAEERERVLDRFYRVDKSRSRELGGAGLGLSISAEIIRLHGGTLIIEGGEGDGTVVRVSLAAEALSAPAGLGGSAG